MPSRVIREGMLDSQRYWSVTIEARELYRHLQLLADDFGCVSLAPVFVRRRCFNDGPSQTTIDKLLEQLFGADLVRVYEIAGARYGFIPRFRQRLQRMTLKHPAPPTELLQDDDDAKQKFAKFQADSQKINGSGTVGQRLPTVGHPPKGSEVEIEVESKRREKEVEAKGEGEAGRGAPAAGQTGSQTERRTPAQQEGQGLMQWATENGLKRTSTESEIAFNRRATAAYMASLNATASTAQPPAPEFRPPAAPPSTDPARDAQYQEILQRVRERADNAPARYGKPHVRDKYWVFSIALLDEQTNRGENKISSELGRLCVKYEWFFVKQSIKKCVAKSLYGHAAMEFIKNDLFLLFDADQDDVLGAPATSAASAGA